MFAQEVRSLTERQRHALDDLASLVMDVLDLHRHRQLLHHALLAADQVRAELERSNTALEQFAGQVSHDLKNPLTGITGHAGLLGELPGVSEDAQASAFVHRIEAATSRMNRTIEAALSLARAGGRLRLADTDLQVVAREAVEDLREDLTRAGAHVCLGAPAVVTCDPTQIRRLLQNLMANAVKFRRPDRPARIEVSCDNDADGWNIRVTDNGVGIPAEQRRNVLEPFVRLDTGAPGSGIGLATCLRIAVAHRGTLTVDAAVDGGTTVTCHLPYPPGTRD